MPEPKPNPWPAPLPYAGKNEVRFHNRVFVHFSGCDYFRLARDPRLAAAAKKTLAETGLNVSASRLTTGNREVYLQLEAALAKFFHAGAALIVSDGYLAPLAAAQALAGRFTHAFVDERSHNALLDAARMLDCPVIKFPHRDAAALKKLLQKCGRNARALILTDGMFSGDGAVAPLRAYLKILPRPGLILVDDAHGAGVVGRTGQGSLEHAGVGRERIIQCGTLSKALGAFGGVVLSSVAVREQIMAHSRSFVGTTPLPPPLAGAALASVKILSRDTARRKRLFANLSWLRTRLRTAGWEIAETPGAIVRLPDLSDAEAARLKKNLLAAGIYPPFVKYGAVARGTFRFVISSEHTRAQLNKLAGVLGHFISTAR
ncbi:MAG: pyridoxal phosphate-dependent aminotransferase family protein [Verrucomicrobiae bacterium]|nr:pyridoxal phosphate-dependent aminotransferase family protein [Verrucomicrobiae bacterium]